MEHANWKEHNQKKRELIKETKTPWRDIEKSMAKWSYLSHKQIVEGEPLGSYFWPMCQRRRRSQYPAWVYWHNDYMEQSYLSWKSRSHVCLQWSYAWGHLHWILNEKMSGMKGKEDNVSFLKLKHLNLDWFKFLLAKYLLVTKVSAVKTPYWVYKCSKT